MRGSGNISSLFFIFLFSWTLFGSGPLSYQPRKTIPGTERQEGLPREKVSKPAFPFCSTDKSERLVNLVNSLSSHSIQRLFSWAETVPGEFLLAHDSATYISWSKAIPLAFPAIAMLFPFHSFW